MKDFGFSIVFEYCFVFVCFSFLLIQSNFCLVSLLIDAAFLLGC